MIKNYLLITWRNLVRNKVYSFINLFGLTIGLAAFLLIALYIFDELTFDCFHKDVANIYRVYEEKTSAEGKESKVSAVAYKISESAKKDFPELKNATRLSMIGRSNIKDENSSKTFYESHWLADEDFLRVFDFKVLEGDRQSALSAPHSVILTEEFARKLYGSINVTGKRLLTDRDSVPYTITAILDNFPTNSHIRFNLAFSEATLNSNNQFINFISNDWSSNTFLTYLQLKEGQPREKLAAKLNKVISSHRQDDASLLKSNYVLQPLKDIHFYSQGIEGSFSNGNIFYIYVFLLVGLFVITIACINYMNLATARFAKRAKEIAVRKVAGAERSSLILQFLMEALVMVTVALLLAIGLVRLFLPAFNSFTEKQLTLGLSTDYRIWIGIILITLLAGIAAGTYPAFFQSGHKPLHLLKNRLASSKGEFTLRQGLVVFQFGLSIIMIISTMVVYLQMKYVSKKNMGFNKEQLLVVDINSGAVRRGAATIKEEFEKLSGVKSVSVTSRVPGEWKVLPKIRVQASTRAASTNDMYFIGADDRFLKTFGVELISGRNFNTARPADSSAIMLNETAAKLLNIHKPTEQLITIPSVAFSGNASTLDEPFSARVIGIVRDFNFRSLREPVAPMVIAYEQNPIHNIDYFTSRVATGNIPATLAQMETVLRKIDPEHLFEYNFLDKQWELFYRDDQKRQAIFMAIAIMTILIACLGLFGLATYSAQQRIKEIGIRKVLGASVGHIVGILTKDFLRLVLIAALIAFPLAWWAMNSWLNDFAYKIDMSWWIFVLAAGIAVMIAFVTISLQAFRSAMSNPVKSLRTE